MMLKRLREALFVVTVGTAGLGLVAYSKLVDLMRKRGGAIIEEQDLQELINQLSDEERELVLAKKARTAFANRETGAA